MLLILSVCCLAQGKILSDSFKKLKADVAEKSELKKVQ